MQETDEMYEPRWYDASTKNMTLFFLRMAVSLLPAAFALYVMNVMLFLVSVYTQQVTQ